MTHEGIQYMTDQLAPATLFGPLACRQCKAAPLEKDSPLCLDCLCKNIGALSAAMTASAAGR